MTIGYILNNQRTANRRVVTGEDKESNIKDNISVQLK